MSKVHIAITGAATAALLAASVIPSALGSSGPAHRTVDSKIGVTFDVLTFLNGQSTTYHPFVDDPGSQCWYDSQNNRNWMQMPGLNVEGPGPRDTSGGSAFGAVGTFDLGLTGSGGDFTDFLNAQLDQRARSFGLRARTCRTERRPVHPTLTSFEATSRPMPRRVGTGR